MKNLALILLSAAILIGGYSCKKEQTTPPISTPPIEKKWTLKDQSLDETSHVIPFEINAGSDVSWTMTEDAEWLDLSTTSGKGSCQAQLMMKSSDEAAKRTATVTFQAGSVTRTATIEQAAFMPKENREELLAGANTKSWLTTSIKLNGDDIWSNSENCSKDNLMIFKRNKTSLLDEGSTKCNPDDPQNYPGTWHFNSNQTRLTVTDDVETIEYKVLEITATRLRLEQSLEDGNFLLEVTMIAQ